MHTTTLRRVLWIALPATVLGVFWLLGHDDGQKAMAPSGLEVGADGHWPDGQALEHSGRDGSAAHGPEPSVGGVRMAPSSSAAPHPSRRVAAAPTRQVQLELEVLDSLGGPWMFRPTVAVIDDEGTQRGLLGLQRPLSLLAGEGRAFGLRATSPGWEVLSPSILPTAEGPNRVPVRSRAALWLVVRDADRGGPVTHFDAVIETQWVDGCCPIGITSLPFAIQSAEGASAIEGLDVRAPIDGSGTTRARALVTATGFQPAASEWVALEPGVVQVEVALLADPRQPGTLEVQVLDGEGQPLAGIEVTAFEEDDSAPILDIYDSGQGVTALRATSLEVLREPVRGTTDSGGRARLAVRAPQRYALHALAGLPGQRTRAFERNVDVPERGSAEVRLVLTGTGELAGQVLGTPQDWHVAGQLGPVVLEREGRRMVAELEPGGAFSFAGLAAGSYRLQLMATGSGMTVATREVEIVSHAGANVVLSPKTPASLQIQLPGVDADGPLTWLVAVGALVDGRPEPRLQRQGSSGETLWVEPPDEAELFVAALGRNADETVVAFALSDGITPASGPTALTVGPETLTLVGRGPRAQAARLSLREGGPIASELVGSAPALTVPLERTVRVRGLPPGGVTVQVGEAALATHASGLVELP